MLKIALGLLVDPEIQHPEIDGDRRRREHRERQQHKARVPAKWPPKMLSRACRSVPESHTVQARPKLDAPPKESRNHPLPPEMPALSHVLDTMHAPPSSVAASPCDNVYWLIYFPLAESK